MKKNGHGKKPCPSTKRQPRRIPEVLTEQEQARLLEQIDIQNSSGIRNRAIIRVFLDTGLRASELINLRLRDLDLAVERLWVRQGKGRKDRGLWFNGGTRAALEAWLNSSSVPRSSSDRVFTSLDGRKPLCGRWLRRMVKQLSEGAGIAKDVHLHTLRHTFATDLLRKTKNLRLVQIALGHANIGTTTIYTHIVDEELEQAMKDLRNGG